MAFTAEEVEDIRIRYGLEELTDGEFALYRAGTNDLEKRSRAYLVGDDALPVNVMSTVFGGQNEVLVLDGTALADADGLYEEVAGSA